MGIGGKNSNQGKVKAMESSLEELADERAGICCISCGDELSLTDEIFLFRIMHVVEVSGSLQLVDVLSVAGGYMYEPVFMCFDCWEEAQEEVAEQLEDVPPIAADGGIAECDICRSDIMPGETFAVSSFGELQWSDRAPNFVYTPRFVPMQKDIHVCIGCLTHLEENRDTPIWADGVDPLPGRHVCVEGLFERCWRSRSCEKGNCRHHA